MTDAPLAGVSVRIEGVGEAISDSGGRFEITAPGSQQARVVVVTSPLVITRETRLLAPGPHARVALMPASLDLVTFDELFRYSGGALHRWTMVPSVVVCDRVLRFTNVTDVEYSATAATLADADVQSLVQDLAWGLAHATGNTYGAFASTRRETPSAGDRVDVSRTGMIVVARYEGLEDATDYVGYGRWATDRSGAVVSGIVMLDARFEGAHGQYLRMLRVHELGHALGYGHVTAKTSFMNPDEWLLPTAFDEGAARLAFQRPPLNRPPDIDPAPFTANLHTGEVIWSGLP
jgi:hypothetical protein